MRWIFLTPRPPPHSISVGSPGHYPSPCPGSAKCDPAPLIARGGRSAASEAGLLRPWLGRPPSPDGVHRPQAALRAWPLQVGRARLRPPAHTLLGAPGGACLLAESLPRAILWDQEPSLRWCLQQGCSRPQAVPLLSAVTFTTKQTSLRRGASPNKQAHWPRPELQAPLPRGVSVPVSHS